MAPTSGTLTKVIASLGQAAGSRPSFRLRHKILVFGVVLPTALAVLYYGLIAFNRYVSESIYVVNASDSRKLSGLDLLMQTFGVAHSDDSSKVQAYLLSRDAVKRLEQLLPLRDYFSAQGGDVFACFPYFWQNNSFESLYDYYLDHVSVLVLASKGVSKIRVAAFEPQHAHDIAAALLALAEEKVNELNERSEADAIDSSARDVQFAQARLIAAQRAVTDFRTHEMLLDPSASSIGVLQTITTLSTELSQTLVQISESSRLSADAPGLQALKSRADALTVAIAAQRGKIGGAGDSFAPKVAAYEQMNLTLDLAKRELAATSTALELARQEARRKKIYVETVSAPSLPDDTREPQRIRMILTVFVFSSALSSVVWLLKAGVKEHAIE